MSTLEQMQATSKWLRDWRAFSVGEVDDLSDTVLLLIDELRRDRDASDRERSGAIDAHRKAREALERSQEEVTKLRMRGIGRASNEYP